MDPQIENPLIKKDFVRKSDMAAFAEGALIQKMLQDRKFAELICGPTTFEYCRLSS
jgi:hypothetical protein